MKLPHGIADTTIYVNGGGRFCNEFAFLVPHLRRNEIDLPVFLKLLLLARVRQMS